MPGNDATWFSLEPAPQRGWRTGEANTLSLVHAWEPPAPVGLGQDGGEEFDPFADSGTWLQPDQSELQNLPSPPGDQQRPWWQPQIPSLDPLQAINALGSNIQSTLQQWTPPTQQAAPQTVQPETFPDTQIGPQTQGAMSIWSKPRQPSVLERADIAQQGGSLPQQTPEYNFPTKIEPAGTSQYPPQGNIMELFGKAAENVTQTGLSMAPQGVRDFLRQPVQTPFAGTKLPFSPADVSSFAADPSMEFLNAAPLVAAVAAPAGRFLGPIGAALLKKITPSNELMPLTVPVGREFLGAVGGVLTNPKLLGGIPLAGGGLGAIGGAAANIAAADDPNKTPWERAFSDLGAGLGGALGGGIVGGTSAGLVTLGLIKPAANMGVYLRGLGQGKDLEFHFAPTIEETLLPETKEFMDWYNKGRKIAQGFVVGEMPKPYYPGGWHGLLWDNFVRTPFSDHWAMLQSWQKSINDRVGRMAETDKAYDQARLLAGVQGRVQRWTAEEIAPVLNRAGVTNTETREQFDMLNVAWEAARRAVIGKGTGEVLQADDPRIIDKARTIMGDLARAGNLETGVPNLDVSGTWARAFFELTGKYDKLLQEMEGVGLLGKGSAKTIADEHPSYMYFKQVEKQMSDMGISMPKKTAIPEGDLVGLEHSDQDHIIADLPTTISHMWNIIAAIEKQKVGQSLVNWSERDADGFGRIFIRGVPRFRPTPRPPANNAPALHPYTVEGEFRAQPGLPEPTSSPGLPSPGLPEGVPSTQPRALEAGPQPPFVREVPNETAGALPAPRVRGQQPTPSSEIPIEPPGHVPALPGPRERGQIPSDSQTVGGIPQAGNAPVGQLPSPPVDQGLVPPRALDIPEAPFAGATRGEKGWEWHGGPVVPTGWDVVKIYEDGNPVSFLTPKWMQETLLGLNPKQADLMTKMMAPLSYPFRLGATVFNPAFSLFYNPSRDLQQAYQNIGYGGPLLKNFFGTIWNLLQSPEFAPRVQARVPYGMTGAIGGVMAAPAPSDTVTPQQSRDLRIAGAGAGMLAGLGGKLTVEQLAQRTNIFSTMERWLTTPEAQSVLREYLRGGGRVGTISESVRGEREKTIGNLLGLKEDRNIAGKAMDVITSPFTLMRTAAEIAELATRGSVYTVARKSEVEGGMGLNKQAASLLARDSTVDFSKGGDAMRILGLWVPLLNARVQGTLRSAKALQEDPNGFLTRSAVMAAIPALATQAWNRSRFSDLYDKIPQDQRDRYFPIVVGSYRDSLLGDEKPLYLKIPKNDITSLISAPIVDMFDLMFHSKNHGIDLSPEQRTEHSRNLGMAFADRVLNLSPIVLHPEDFTNPGKFLWGTVTNAQVPGAFLQLATNHDHFRDTDIVPSDPSIRRARPSASLLAKLGGDFMAKFGGKDMYPAPEQVEFGINAFSATLGQEFLGALDQLTDALGVQPPLPPGVPERVDNRPRWAALTSAIGLSGSSGSAQTVVEKLKQLPDDQQKIWAETQFVYREYAKMRQEARAKINQIYQRGDANGAKIMSDVADVQTALKAEQQRLYANYPKALKTTDERKAFSQSLPGVPLQAGLFSDSADLPPNVDLQTVSQRYYNPPGTTPEQMAMLPPQTVDQLRGLELQRISREVGVNPKVLLENIKFNTGGGKLPPLGVPDNFIEDAVNRWMTPTTSAFLKKDSVTGEQYVDPDLLRQARKTELAVMSTESGIPVPQLEERIKARIQADPMTTQEKSAMGAFRFSDAIHDPAKFAPYMTADYKPLSGYGPKDWAQWDVTLEQAAAKGIVNTQVLALKKARAYANAAKVQYMQDPHNYDDYKDYERWFGVGRSMSATDWANYQTGKYPRYTDAGSTPSQWDQRDLVQRMWRTLPDGDYRKGNLAPIAARYRAMMAKDWKAKMDFDTFQSKVVQGDYESLDRALQLQR